MTMRAPTDAQPYAVLSIGGFLGMGSHLVVVPYDSLKFADNKVVLPGGTKEGSRCCQSSNTLRGDPCQSCGGSVRPERQLASTCRAPRLPPPQRSVGRKKCWTTRAKRHSKLGRKRRCGGGGRPCGSSCDHIRFASDRREPIDRRCGRLRAPLSRGLVDFSSERRRPDVADKASEPYLEPTARSYTR